MAVSTPPDGLLRALVARTTSLRRPGVGCDEDEWLLFNPFRSPVSARRRDNLLPSYSNMFLLPFVVHPT